MNRALLFGILTLLFILHQACEDMSVIDDPTAQLEFSHDTIRFDTVFTEVGSATRSFRVKNPHSQAINVSSIQLGNTMDQFRLNIDGVPTNSASDITILAGDSLWIFVELTIDPDLPLSISPFIIQEQVFLVTNGNEQVVHLEAWGQNANYIPNRFSAGAFTRISCNNDSLRFDDPKPYVIYGVLIVDSCHLVLPKGTFIHVHGGVARSDENVIFNDGLIAFTNNASLQSRGTLDDPVVITADRLEREFADIPGQWSGIRFLGGSRGNRMSHTKVSNSIVGVRADSASFVRLENVEIRNTAGPGLIGIHATMIGQNCLIADNGTYGGLFTYGGNYAFFHSTFANYAGQSSALRLDNFRCIDGDCSNGALSNRMIANFTNCIFFGNDTDEIELQDIFEGEEPSLFNYTLTNCVVAVDELINPDQYPLFFDNCHDCINAGRDELLFVDHEMGDYHLDTMSVAIGAAIPLQLVDTDIEGNPRDLDKPDIGCYEFLE